MQIKNRGKFFGGIFIALLSIIPFSYMNHADKFKKENFYSIDGTIEKLYKTTEKSSNIQTGWLIKLSEYDYKFSISGEYYNAINQKRFNKLIKPGAKAKVFMLKPEHYGVFEKLESIFGGNAKDATTLLINETEVLSLNSIRANIRRLFIQNLLMGFAAIGFALYLIYQSFKE